VSSISKGAIAIGLVEVVGGFIVAYHLDLAPGPTITIGATAVFIVVYVIRFATSDRTYVHHSHEHAH
jgi:ABC-type Mn2+/Zn2+ transport system permease subunit